MADAYPPDNRPVERPPSQWWLIARGVGVASDPRAILLAALGLTALRAGWMALASAMGREPWLDPSAPAFIPGFGGLDGPHNRPIGETLATIGRQFAPFIAIFRADLSAWSRCEAALASFWALVVWGLFGGAIARIAVVRVATGGGVGLLAALKFSAARIGSTVAAPVAPIVVAVLIGLAGAAVGLLDRLPGSIGTSVATVLAIIPLVVGLLDTVILVGLALAWPLMVATVVAEGEDFFDAVSRSYSYVNQRTTRYAAYLAVATVVGAIGLVAVGLFASAALGLADWSVSLGAPRHGGFRFLDPASAGGAGLPAVAHFWTGFVETLAAGWISSYFWTVAAILYLVLRHDVDGADVHDIYEPSRVADETGTTAEAPAA